MKPFKVFIHTNPKQILGAIVGRHTMKQASRNPDAFDVEFINTADFPVLSRRDGKHYLREGHRVRWKNDDLQSFTPLRFLPPHLMGFQGRALVTDPDVFALKDISSLATMDMQGKAIAARQIPAKDGRPAYWATSVMLLDCAKLKHWQWEANIEKMFRFQLDYRDWMSLALEDQSSILPLPEEWNHYDTLDDATILLHNTARLTQPWKTGLPVDFSFEKNLQPKKGGALRSWLRMVKRAIIAPPPKNYPKYYRSHPDKNQERFFFRSLQQVIERGELDENFLRDEIQKNHLRKDAFEVLKSL